MIDRLCVNCKQRNVAGFCEGGFHPQRLLENPLINKKLLGSNCDCFDEDKNAKEEVSFT